MPRKPRFPSSRLARLKRLEDELRAVADEYAQWRAELPTDVDQGYVAFEVDRTIETLKAAKLLLQCALPGYAEIPF
jgi:hypothetical protein